MTSSISEGLPEPTLPADEASKTLADLPKQLTKPAEPAIYPPSHDLPAGTTAQAEATGLVAGPIAEDGESYLPPEEMKKRQDTAEAITARYQKIRDEDPGLNPQKIRTLTRVAGGLAVFGSAVAVLLHINKPKSKDK